MTNILPLEPARTLCLELASKLDFSQLGKALKQPGHGRMLGILVCTDGTVYKAFSGLLEGQYEHEGFVPPVFPAKEMEDLLALHDGIIKTSNDPMEASRTCWNKVQKLYSFHCYDGLTRTLDAIFPNAPSGTGDCCAPKLLNHAYSLGKKPLSLAEFFYGSGSSNHMQFHSPCDFRCRPILKHILGLDIVHYDGDIVVVDKPSGMLSIEGKGPDKQDCIASRVRSLYERCIQQPCVHRLDQATSGLLVLGLTKTAHDRLSLSFERKEVNKTYEALVHGIVEEPNGVVDLPIRLDVSNRPHQIVDLENGRCAVTKWRRLSIENRYGTKCTRLELEPLTGRTHQLRMHCTYGLGHPILGDTLYGNLGLDTMCNVPRMMLQAKKLSFNHPVSGEPVTFELESDF